MNLEELRARAEQGDVVAQSILGIRYLYGDGVPVDYEEARRFLKLASDRGAARALLNLGFIFRKGLGVSQDLKEAARLYELAAGKGEFLAQIELARMHTQSDPDTAVNWYRLALEQESRVNASEELAEARSYVAAHRPND
jgi:TPR repeat protein